MRVVIVVQARMGSTRLPRKVLMPLAGAPLLQRMIERVRAAALPAGIVIATTSLPEDEAIRDLCSGLDVPCFSGHPTDLLDRHYQAAREYEADVVVKIPSDCPLIDPRVIDRVIGFYLQHHTAYDYVSNLHPATYPDGQDVEVMPMAVLEAVWHQASRPMEREHTTPFIWEQPERFRIGNVPWEQGLDYSMSHRWTIDYPEDYVFLDAVFGRLYRQRGPVFSLEDVLHLLEREPGIASINGHLAGVNWYRNHLDELRTIAPSMTRTMIQHS